MSTMSTSDSKRRTASRDTQNSRHHRQHEQKKHASAAVCVQHEPVIDEYHASLSSSSRRHFPHRNTSVQDNRSQSLYLPTAIRKRDHMSGEYPTPITYFKNRNQCNDHVQSYNLSASHNITIDNAMQAQNLHLIIRLSSNKSP